MDSDNNTSSCANCGKGEENSITLKKCGACKMVKYCSSACQKAHRAQHKKECKKRAAELHEEALFKQPPPPEDCPICMLPLPFISTGKRHKGCCAKVICSGCIYAVSKMTAPGKNTLCPFCRVPSPTTEEENVERLQKHVDSGHPDAIYTLGTSYYYGQFGCPIDYEKAIELWQKAAKLGCNDAYNNLGTAYSHGHGVEFDTKMAQYYFELAAMGGSEESRNALGQIALRTGHWDKALRHFMIAVECGEAGSLEKIRSMHMVGAVTKDAYTKALRSYQTYLGEIRSDQRDEAAAAWDEYKYY